VPQQAPLKKTIGVCPNQYYDTDGFAPKLHLAPKV